MDPTDYHQHAFPYDPNTPGPAGAGMLLRDYFAGMAIIGIVGMNTDMYASTTSANQAYRMADAMMEARIVNGQSSMVNRE